MSSNINLRKIGEYYESLACEFLLNKGYRILERNFFIRGGEIDIIADFENYIVFLEVKSRNNLAFGHPLESISNKKIVSLTKTAEQYIYVKDLNGKNFRIDLISIFDYNNNIDIKHIENISF